MFISNVFQQMILIETNRNSKPSCLFEVRGPNSYLALAGAKMTQGMHFINKHSGKSCYLQIFARSIINSPAVVITDFFHSSVITDNPRILTVQRVAVTQSPADLTALRQWRFVAKTIHIIHPDNAISYNQAKTILSGLTSITGFLWISIFVNAFSSKFAFAYFPH